MWLLNWRMAVHVADGELTGAESSSIKVFGTERIIEVTRLLLGIIGAAGYLTPGSPGAVLRGRVEATGRQAQINTFGGGVNEVQREIVATAGLGMKRGRADERRRFEELAPFPDHSAELAALVGQSSGEPQPVTRRRERADDPPLGRGHGRRQPDLRVRRGGPGRRLRRLIAPPTMLQAWIMRGLRASQLTEAAREAGAPSRGAAPTRS